MRKQLWRRGWMVVALVICSLAAHGQERASLLVTPAWLAGHLHDVDLVLLHVGDKAEYDAAHIPGAQFIKLSDISEPDMSKPHDMSGATLMLELPTMEKLKEAFESRGISNTSRIVVYFGKDWVSPSTRVIWTLTYVGLGDRVSLLDGGMPAWRAAGQAVTSDVKTPARGHLTPQLHPEILADAAWVSGHLRQPAVALIDARQPGDYAGIENPRNMPRVGHIPGAQNLPIEILVDDQDRLKNSSAIADLFKSAGVTPGAQVVSYCYVGQRATLIWFAARLLGYEARMYDGSWDEWSKHKDWPVETSAPGASRDK